MGAGGVSLVGVVAPVDERLTDNGDTLCTSDGVDHEGEILVRGAGGFGDFDFFDEAGAVD